MDSSVSRCWRAPWFSIPTGCCWTKSTTGSTLLIDVAWIRRSRPRAAAVNRGWPLRIVQPTCRRELADGRVHAVKRVLASDLKRLSRRSGERPSTGARPAPAAQAGSSALLRLSKVHLYVGYRSVLRNLNWQILKGEHWAVYGANGSGKSSLLKLLYGDLSPALGGRIERSGLPNGTSIAEWKRQVGYVSPELQADYAIDVSVFDLVASGRYSSIGLADEPTARDRRMAARWLKFFVLLAAAKSLPRELSYGQLRRALIARAMAADPRILLLDEPLTGLDPRQRAIMKRLLEKLMRRLTLIIAVHHPEDLPRGMTHALRLHNRRAYEVDSHSAT